MYEKMNTVRIGGKNLPIRCDFSVLQTLQDEFGTLRQFEQKLLGMIPIVDDNGEPIFVIGDDGTEQIKFKTTEPSLRAIAVALPIMINEGRIRAEEQGEEVEDFDYKEAIKDAEFSILDVSIALHTEYKRCFDGKKAKVSTRTATKKSR